MTRGASWPAWASILLEELPVDYGCEVQLVGFRLVEPDDASFASEIHLESDPGSEFRNLFFLGHENLNSIIGASVWMSPC